MARSLDDDGAAAGVQDDLGIAAAGVEIEFPVDTFSCAS